MWYETNNTPAVQVCPNSSSTNKEQFSAQEVFYSHFSPQKRNQPFSVPLSATLCLVTTEQDHGTPSGYVPKLSGCAALSIFFYHSDCVAYVQKLQRNFLKQQYRTVTAIGVFRKMHYFTTHRLLNVWAELITRVTCLMSSEYMFDNIICIIDVKLWVSSVPHFGMNLKRKNPL